MKFYSTLLCSVIFLIFTKSYTYSQVFNELGVAPTSSDGSIVGYSSSAGGSGQGEWIELYNPTCSTIDLSGYIIGTYNGWDGNGMSLIIPNGKTIGPNGFAIIRGINKAAPGAGVTDIPISETNASSFCVESPNPGAGGETRMWFQNGGAWMALYDKNGVPKDMVKWGNLSDPTDLSGNPCVPSGSSLPGTTTLASYNSYGAGNSISTAGTMGKSFVRLPDGGNWSNTLANETTSYGSSNQPLTATLNYTTPFCTGATTQSPTLTGSGSYTGGTYSSTTGLTIDANTGIITPSSSTAGTYTITYTKTGLACPGYVTKDITITDPTVTATKSDPTCNGASVNSDGTITVTVTNGTAPIQYSTDNGATYTYNTSPITGLGNGSYTIKIKDSKGCTANISSAFVMNTSCSVSPCVPPTIDSQPNSTTKCEGSNATFTVAASGTVNAYQWQEDNGSGNGFVSIPGANTTTLTLSNITSAMNNYNYKCILGESNNSCPSSTNTVKLSVDANPTSSAGGTSSICSDATATVSGATASTGTTLSWTENGAGSITSGATTLTPTYTAATGDAGNTITLTLKTTSGNSCPNPADVNYTLTIDPLPTATAGGTTTICSSATATVSGATSANGSILWTHNGTGSLSNATTLTPTYTPTVSDEGNTVTLTLTVTSTNACSTSVANTATATYTIQVTGAVSATATAGGSSTICVTKSTTVSGATSSNGTILWTHNGFGSLTNDNTLTPTYSSVEKDTISPVTLTMTVTPGAGCSGSTATANYTVNVNNLPKVQPTSTIPCEGTDVLLDANTIAGAQYAWSGPNAYSKAIKNPTVPKVTAADTGLFTLQITDANNCVNSASIRVTMYANPIITGDTFVCVGKTINLVGSTLGNASSWLSQTTANLTIDANTGVATGVLGGSSNVTYTDVNGCSDNQPILIEDLPVVIFTVDSTSICLGNDVQFTDNSVKKNTNIVWDFGDGTQSITPDPSHTYQKVDSFTVILTSTSPNGCVGSLTKTKYITPIEVPTMSFGYTPDSIDIFNPYIQFINYSNANYYTWKFDDYSPVSSQNNPLHIFPETPGKSYKVTLKGSNSKSGICPASISHQITSIDPAIYYIPNTFTPNGDEVNNTFQPIFTSGFDPQEYVLWIYNRYGELVFESHNASIGWDGTYNNVFAETNTYVWKLQFKAKQTGKEYYRTGHVNLVK